MSPTPDLLVVIKRQIDERLATAEAEAMRLRRARWALNGRKGREPGSTARPKAKT